MAYTSGRYILDSTVNILLWRPTWLYLGWHYGLMPFFPELLPMGWLQALALTVMADSAFCIIRGYPKFKEFKELFDED